MYQSSGRPSDACQAWWSPYLLVCIPICWASTVTSARYRRMASRQVTGRANSAEDTVSVALDFGHCLLDQSYPSTLPLGLGFVQPRLPVSQTFWLAGEGIPPLRLLMEGPPFFFPPHMCVLTQVSGFYWKASLVAHAKSPGYPRASGIWKQVVTYRRT